LDTVGKSLKGLSRLKEQTFVLMCPESFWVMNCPVQQVNAAQTVREDAHSMFGVESAGNIQRPVQRSKFCAEHGVELRVMSDNVERFFGCVLLLVIVDTTSDGRA
jgi:hypothetical protein